MEIMQTALAEVNFIDWNEIWWGICKSVLQIINWIGKAFDFLIGANPVLPADGGGTEQTTTNVLEGILTDETSKINPSYWYIGLACIAIMGVYLAV